MNDIATAVMRLRILGFALIAGPTIFLAITLGLTLTTEHHQAEPSQPLSLILLAVTYAAFIQFAVIRALVTKLKAKRLTRSNFVQSYTGLLVMRIAFLEGPTILGIVSFLLAGLAASPTDHPWLFLNLLPYLIYVPLVLRDMPSQAAMASLQDSLPDEP